MSETTNTKHRSGTIPETSPIIILAISHLHGFWSLVKGCGVVVGVVTVFVVVTVTVLVVTVFVCETVTSTVLLGLPLVLLEAMEGVVDILLVL